METTHAEGPVMGAFKCPWLGWAYHSVHTAQSKGVSVLISKNTHFELQDLTQKVDTYS